MSDEMITWAFERASELSNEKEKIIEKLRTENEDPSDFDYEKESVILDYYRDGKEFCKSHDRCIVNSLKDSGYLRCGITENLNETLRTTDNGINYLKWIKKHM